jgi:hypothetical protein
MLRRLLTYIAARYTAPMTSTATPLTPAAATAPRVMARLAVVAREIARGGLASGLAGLIVGGLGGRLVMRVAAMLNPDATGLRTETGELVGAITANGTLALVVFGGLLTGAAAGVVWVVVSPWLPGRGRVRWLLAMPVAVALVASLLIQATNRDFRILGQDGPVVGLLVALVALTGAATAWLDERLERKLPRPGPDPWPALAMYGTITLLGLLFVPALLTVYFANTISPYPPDRVGVAVVVVGLVTLVAWVARVVSGRVEPPAVVRTAGRIALVAAVLIGFAHILPEIGRIIPPE